MTWTLTYSRETGSWLPQLNICDRTVNRIGRFYHMYRMAGSAVIHYVRRLTGETYRPREAMEEISRLLKYGRLEYRDGKICYKPFGTCVESYDFFRSIEEFYTGYREMRKAIRDVDIYCRKEKPKNCRNEVEKYIKSIEDLWKIPVNPKKALRDIRFLGISKDPKLKEALEKYSRFAINRIELIRCASVSTI